MWLPGSRVNKNHAHIRRTCIYRRLLCSPCVLQLVFLFSFLFFTLSPFSSHSSVSHPSLIAIASFVSFALFLYLFFLFNHTPEHPIFRAIRISRLLLSVHCSVRSGVFTYFSLSLSRSFLSLSFPNPLLPFPGTYTRRRVFTRYKRKLFNLQHSADFEDKQLEIGKRNKTRQFDNNDYFIAPCACMWWCLCGTRDCAWALNVKRMTHISGNPTNVHNIWVWFRRRLDARQLFLWYSWLLFNVNTINSI